MNASANNVGRLKSWLDIEIELDVGIGPARWIVLWGLALAGGLIPERDGIETEFRNQIITLFIAAYWHRSVLLTKVGLVVGLVLIAFLNANLPIPGFGYGYLLSSGHWPHDPLEIKTLLALAGVACGWHAIEVTLLHFIPHFLNWCGLQPPLPTSYPPDGSENHWSPSSATAISSLVCCSRKQTNWSTPALTHEPLHQS